MSQLDDLLARSRAPGAFVERKHFTLSPQGKGALAVFAVAATWWIFEVVPIGVTSLLIGSLQALFLIRKPAVAFKDFMDPSVLFIFGSVVIGMVFTKTGLTRRIAYKMLSIIGEKSHRFFPVTSSEGSSEKWLPSRLRSSTAADEVTPRAIGSWGE